MRPCASRVCAKVLLAPGARVRRPCSLFTNAHPCDGRCSPRHALARLGCPHPHMAAAQARRTSVLIRGHALKHADRGLPRAGDGAAAAQGRVLPGRGRGPPGRHRHAARPRQRRPLRLAVWGGAWVGPGRGPGGRRARGAAGAGCGRRRGRLQPSMCLEAVADEVLECRRC